VKVLGDFDPKKLVLNLAPEVTVKLENEDHYIEFINSKSKLSKNDLPFSYMELN